MTDGTFNAIIETADIRLDRGCFLSMWMTLDFGRGSGQGFGGFALDGKPTERMGSRSPHPACGFYIRRVLDTVGVESVSALVGRPIRVERRNGLIEAIGHHLEEKWFRPGKEMESLFQREVTA